jgi:hypothetical protein
MTLSLPFSIMGVGFQTLARWLDICDILPPFRVAKL